MAEKRKRKRAKSQPLSKHPGIREFFSDLELAEELDWMFRRLNDDEWLKERPQHGRIRSEMATTNVGSTFHSR